MMVNIGGIRLTLPVFTARAFGFGFGTVRS